MGCPKATSAMIPRSCAVSPKRWAHHHPRRNTQTPSHFNSGPLPLVQTLDWMAPRAPRHRRRRTVCRPGATLALAACAATSVCLSRAPLRPVPGPAHGATDPCGGGLFGPIHHPSGLAAACVECGGSVGGAVTPGVAAESPPHERRRRGAGPGKSHASRQSPATDAGPSLPAPRCGRRAQRDHAAICGT